jgi:hypothetical protein
MNIRRVAVETGRVKSGPGRQQKAAEPHRKGWKNEQKPLL